MLFNSYIFIFLFLPVTLIIFFAIGSRGNHQIANSWLVVSSLFFYGWWNPVYLFLIIISILFNYFIGIFLCKKSKHQNKISVNNRLLLTTGIVINLGLLVFFKYANFIVGTSNDWLGTAFNHHQIILPLALSFFTFQQIAFLVDANRGETSEYNFIHYCLFVVFFPQLIAGPIVHHRDIIPQFKNEAIYKVNLNNLAVGITIFTIGLFKKVVFADGIATYATPVFSAAFQGIAPSFLEAWCGALSYTMQLYFDFSGYSDMAIGLGWMFGIKLPMNFFSPYKSVNIIEFWSRWHMTLSQFLRDYLYIPLGGNRKGILRRYINLMITMLLGGLWHGSSWMFVFWGGLHGFYLIINHLWRAMQKTQGRDKSGSTILGTTMARCLTIFAVVVGWVFFRAEDLNSAKLIINGMFGINGFKLGILLDSVWKGYIWIIVLSCIVLLLPNSLQLLSRFNPALSDNIESPFRFYWKPNFVWGITIAVMFSLAILSFSQVMEFIYFQF